MKIIGVNFQIPNEYGKFLADILKPIPCRDYQWLIDNDEIHVLKNNEFTNEFLFKDEERIVDGNKLLMTAKGETYYMVFVTLRGFYEEGSMKPVYTGKEFIESDCRIVLAVYDCSYVMFLCKDDCLVSSMYNYALSKGYKAVEHITEEDLIKGKYYIE